MHHPSRGQVSAPSIPSRYVSRVCARVRPQSVGSCDGEPPVVTDVETRGESTTTAMVHTHVGEDTSFLYQNRSTAVVPRPGRWTGSRPAVSVRGNKSVNEKKGLEPCRFGQGPPLEEGFSSNSRNRSQRLY